VSAGVFCQLVEIGDVLYQSAFGELIYEHSPSPSMFITCGGEMQDRALELSWAIRVHAAMIGFAFRAYDVAAADGTMLGMWNSFLPRGCSLSSTTLTTFGITSPPRSTSTQSPILTPSCSMKSRLCSVARETVVRRLERFSAATGVSFPVRPPAQNIFDLRHSSACSVFVSNCHRGALPVKPSSAAMRCDRP